MDVLASPTARIRPNVADDPNFNLVPRSTLYRLQLFMMDIASPWSRFCLDAAGLIALADINTVARRTVLTGNSTWLDIFVLCPGMHKQQNATDLNRGEYPACAAMTTGYVFRVENPAAVCFLQRVGRTGHLTTLNVEELPAMSWWQKTMHSFFDLNTTSLVSITMYVLATGLTLLALLGLFHLRDVWGCTAILIYILIRAINVYIIRARASVDWKGAKEDNEAGSLMILLSQDRWIRMKGSVSDLKAVTSGQWLRDVTATEDSLSNCSTLLIYLNVIVAVNAEHHSKMLLIVLLLCSAALLGIANLSVESTGSFTMAGRAIKTSGKPKKYERRLHMAEELIKETNRRDWAEGLGMVKPESGHYTGQPTM
ncbi:hypothetical protein LTR78_008609 [Recurvomyces mirabilis]|uniref:Uncharacterized protein n=1 Tax=Recurvomyces mirabilis TaxID=574656 RepID=A0AAE0TQ96_9PEZI|nr:hypothetical protein LTR78_008609 [Recurvomyces mirabilis]KAK5153479.1 hypothetical protein LTS14_007650 [Recurvomyces mirabilis]